MLNTLQTRSVRGARLQGVLAACLLAGSGAAAAANVTVNLCATNGVAASPVGVPIYGYASGACPSTVTAPGGPTIVVDVGDVVTVNLQNSLSHASGLLFQGQAMLPDIAGAPAATPSQYGARSYTFTTTSPGTYLYEAAPLPHAEYQAVMGLHGALVVRPAPVALTGAITVTPVDTSMASHADPATYTSGSTAVADAAILATDAGAAVSGPGIAPGTTIVAVTAGVSFTMSAPAAVAYGASTDFNEEAVLVLSEVDPVLHSSADPAVFDMRKYAPRYFLINGKPYPGTDAIASTGGHKVLLRYVNAGARHHSMAVLGPRQLFVAKDASPLPTMNHNVAAETLAPGQTGDAIVTMPAVTTASRFPLYDAGLALHNSNAAGFGGMLTFLSAGAGAAATGPSAGGVQVNPGSTNGSVDVALSAMFNSGSTTTVAAAEYYVDTTGAPGTGTAMTGPFGATSVAAAATISQATLATLASGSHTLYVRGQDATGAWGGFGSGALNLDKAGPATTGLVLTPNPSSGGVSVALSATGNDGASGGANIAAAEYTVDGGAAVAMTLGGAPAPVRSLGATIPLGLAAGAHAVSVRSQDALGNWGPATAITLTVLNAPPVTSRVGASPNPNNGQAPLSATQPVVRVSATMSSAGSTVVGAEGFIDSNPSSTVRGFPFVASDGTWNGGSEAGYADVPLTTINALSAGTHTIYVRGKDATGTWGVTSSTALLIDRTAPTVGVTPATSTVAFGAASVTLTVTAADLGGAGIAGGQYWIDGTTTPPASPIAFTGGSIAVNTATLAAGTHAVRVRVRDAATNWSAVSSVTVQVIRAVADARTIVANTSVAQNSDASGASGVLANDAPTGLTGRTAMLTTAPVRTSGVGTGTLTVTCPTTLGTPATPSIGGNTICTNGAYRAVLTGTGATAALRQASKRGTFAFTYTEILNGVSAGPATVTLTVN